jgi:hypothetical protein
VNFSPNAMSGNWFLRFNILYSHPNSLAGAMNFVADWLSTEMRNFSSLAQIIPDLRKMSIVLPGGHCRFYFMQPLNSPLERLPLQALREFMLVRYTFAGRRIGHLKSQIKSFPGAKTAPNCSKPGRHGPHPVLSIGPIRGSRFQEQALGGTPGPQTRSGKCFRRG